jgi:hypothetical protein
MPRFFFDFIDGDVALDREGTELPDISAARAEAMRILIETLRQESTDLLRAGGCRIRVTDADEVELFRLSLIATTTAQGATLG